MNAHHPRKYEQTPSSIDVCHPPLRAAAASCSQRALENAHASCTQRGRGNHVPDTIAMNVSSASRMKTDASEFISTSSGPSEKAMRKRSEVQNTRNMLTRST